MRLDAFRHIGEPVPDFYCPITLRHGYGDEALINGHILNQKIKSASRATVIQVGDVDGYFGRTIEPDFVNFANVHYLTPQEFVRRATEFSVTDRQTGRAFSSFAASPKSDPRKAGFPVLPLKDHTGSVFAQRFIRASPADLEVVETLRVESVFVMSEPAIIGTLLKSAYLAMFRMLGYSWVVDWSPMITSFHSYGATSTTVENGGLDWNSLVSGSHALGGSYLLMG